MGVRRRAREAALAVLFETEFQQSPHDAVLAYLETEETQKEEFKIFLDELLNAYSRHKNDVNLEIENHSNNWKISRMALVDRNILRLGVTEILFLSDIPKNVTINEYLEVAKKFGTEDSSSFINGILDKIQKKNPV